MKTIRTKQLPLLLLAIALSFSALAQQADTLTKKEQRKLHKQEKIREGAFLITPLAGPAYTPEMGFTIAGGVLMSFRTDKKDSLLQRSSVPVNIGWGSNDVLFLNSKLITFWNHDKLRVYSDINVKNMNDNFFGIGYDSGRNTPKSDSTTGYKRLWFQVYPRALWQFKKGYFVGGGLDINYTKGKDACDEVANNATYMAYNGNPFNTGLGLILQLDTRDVAVNAWKGAFVELDATIYGHYLGGMNNYQVYSVDARKYWKIVKPAHTLAVQVKGRFSFGDVPYAEMSQLGTPFDLRGYLWGQYRDQSMLFGIAEYRHTFYNKYGKPGKHGVVAWVAGGSVASNPSNLKDWLPNGGIGYRLEVQPRMNLRLDWGMGIDGSHGFYFNFNEAF